MLFFHQLKRCSANCRVGFAGLVTLANSERETAMLDQIYGALQVLGVLTILLICVIVGCSIETGRENDRRRAARDAQHNDELPPGAP